DPVATTHDCLVVDRVSEADAWSNISSVRIDESEVRSLKTALPDCSDNRSASSTSRRIRRVGIKAAQESTRFFARTAVVVSDTKVHGKFRCDLDVVLSEECIRKEPQRRIDRLVAVE